MRPHVLVLLVACSGPAPTPGTTVPAPRPTTPSVQPTADTSSTPTASTGDTATTEPPVLPLQGFGTLTGDCDVLDPTLLADATSTRFRATLDVGKAVFDEALLSKGGQEIIADGGLNQGSLESEAIAFDVLHRCELATLLRTEDEVAYEDANGKKTDVLVEVDGVSVGVSVTRAFTFPDCAAPGDLSPQIEDKLLDTALAADNARKKNQWDRTILSVVACDQAHADAVETAWDAADAALRADVILMTTQTDGNDDFLY